LRGTSHASERRTSPSPSPRALSLGRGRTAAGWLLSVGGDFTNALLTGSFGRGGIPESDLRRAMPAPIHAFRNGHVEGQAQGASSFRRHSPRSGFQSERNAVWRGGFIRSAFAGGGGTMKLASNTLRLADFEDCHELARFDTIFDSTESKIQGLRQRKGVLCT
jgi:hypothetical protein